MTININELRSMVNASHFESFANSVINSLLDRIETTEKERDELRDRLALESQENGAFRDEFVLVLDDLQAKVEAMEQQEPVVEVQWAAGIPNSFLDFISTDGYLPKLGDKLYLAPIPPAPSVPDAVIKAAMEAQREGCAEIVLQAAHKAADYNNLRDYELLRALSIAVAKAPEAKP